MLVYRSRHYFYNMWILRKKMFSRTCVRRRFNTEQGCVDTNQEYTIICLPWYREGNPRFARPIKGEAYRNLPIVKYIFFLNPYKTILIELSLLNDSVILLNALSCNILNKFPIGHWNVKYIHHQQFRMVLIIYVSI